jgi:hypothetical protein
MTHEPQAIKHEPRCPHCGTWTSTRYSAGRAHDEALLAAELKYMAAGGHLHGLPYPTLQPGYDPPLAVAGGALNRAGSYPSPENRPNAPATPVKAWALAWLAGLVSGVLVAVLAMALLG